MFKLLIKTFGLHTCENTIRKKVNKKEYDFIFVLAPRQPAGIMGTQLLLSLNGHYILVFIEIQNPNTTKYIKIRLDNI